MTRPAEEIAREFVVQNLNLYSLSRPAVDAAQVRVIHDTGSGGIIVIFTQHVDGLDVGRNEMKVLFDRQGDVIAYLGKVGSSSGDLWGFYRNGGIVRTRLCNSGCRIQLQALGGNEGNEDAARWADGRLDATSDGGLIFFRESHSGRARDRGRPTITPKRVFPG